jgi:AcrR family transcriptional regulator
MPRTEEIDIGNGPLTQAAERIFEATETLCAELGLESVSIRDIAKHAGVSLSVIYHHYGSKEDLLKAVIYRRMDELFSLRKDLFEELSEMEHPPLERVLYAIVAPLPLLRSKGPAGETTSLFLGRVLMSTLPAIKHEVDAGAGRLGLLVDVLQRAAPHLSREDIFWKVHFTIGIAHMTLWDYERLKIMSEGLCNTDSVDEAVARAVDFAKAAFEARDVVDFISGAETSAK